MKHTLASLVDTHIDITESARELLERKQQEYSADHLRPFASFDGAAARLGTTRHTIAMTYLDKQLSGVYNGPMDRSVQALMHYRERIMDAINYLIFAYAMIEEDSNNA